MSNDKPYIKLTTTEQLILNSYKKMIVSLGEYLGEGYEIILHSLENLQHSVIENVNGHYSGRKNGAPITDLALSMLSQLKEEPSQPAVCYMNHSKKGVPLRSCTIPIAGEKERIIGLICINFYTDVPLSSLLYQRGIFNIKDAVLKVASLLGISKNTVYLHIRNLKEQEN